jgi:hypothetical protein
MLEASENDQAPGNHQHSSAVSSVLPISQLQFPLDYEAISVLRQARHGELAPPVLVVDCIAIVMRSRSALPHCKHSETS